DYVDQQCRARPYIRPRLAEPGPRARRRRQRVLAGLPVGLRGARGRVAPQLRLVHAPGLDRTLGRQQDLARDTYGPDVSGLGPRDPGRETRGPLAGRVRGPGRW